MDMSPSHTYAAGGTYTVSLTAENATGSDVETQDIVIEEVATAEAPELTLGDADGAFYAINTVSVQEVAGFETTIKLGSAVAWFVDGGTSFVNVGDVEVENSRINAVLDPQSNNSYVYVETNIPSEGFSNQGVTWSIAGGNGHSPVNGLANLLPFPSTNKVDESASDISGATAYTLVHDGAINNADSSIFAVHGPDGSVMKTVEGATTSVTFSASEMASVGSGAGILQIASFSILDQTVGGKKYYMVNESVANKNVNIN
jgi:PKD repeat protein